MNSNIIIPDYIIIEYVLFNLGQISICERQVSLTFFTWRPFGAGGARGAGDAVA